MNYLLMLTNYECPASEEERATDSDLYYMLVKIQRLWDEITHG